MVDVAAATEELIDRYAPDIDIPPPVVLEQARRNLALRVAMLEEFGAIEAKELAKLAGSTARNPATTVDNWRRADRIVTVRWQGRTLVPGFQLLESGQPDPAVRPVLHILRAYGMTDWEQALWFCVPSPALEGARPVDRLLAFRGQPEAEGSTDLAALAARRRDWF
ncbi:MAG TPA: hypothetical protein VMF65_23880 [Acidimicrobiales bacterium]|nr:hypothetical protein [Acidimicrobiales bacterium]